MGYWIFKCKPDKYKLTERLADPNPTLTWTVSRYRDQINQGDMIFIWETGEDRGIRAVIRATSAPQDMPELESEQQYWVERDTEVRCRVLAEFTQRHVRLSANELRGVPGLENLSMFHGFQQGTNFPVTPSEGAIIENLIRRKG